MNNSNDLKPKATLVDLLIEASRPSGNHEMPQESLVSSYYEGNPDERGSLTGTSTASVSEAAGIAPYFQKMRQSLGGVTRDTSHSSSATSQSIDSLPKVTFASSLDEISSLQEGQQQEAASIIIKGHRKTPGAHVRLKLLPIDFEPSEHDVLCGRGRTCKLWKGNLEYRQLVADNLEAYSAAKSKLDKGAILSSIVDKVRRKSRSGGFVKKDPESGRWYEVGDFLAREKTSQYFRDALHEQYSSSTQAKYNRRKSEVARKRTAKKQVPPVAPRVSENEGTSGESSAESTICQPPKRPELERRLSEDAVASVLQQMKSAMPIKAAVPIEPSHVRVCALQLKMRQPDETPLAATQRTIDSMSAVARNEDIDLFVLPELSPVGYSEDTFARFLPATPIIQDIYLQIDQLFAEQARRLKVYICYGTIGWKTRDDGSLGYTIRQVVLDRTGKQVAHYDKSYLCDFGSCAETRFFEPGPSQPVSFSVNDFTFGMLICADMRYPNLSRSLARDHKVDVILQPAAFARDISFRTWKSFRETRAVENGVYWVGVNYAGEHYGETSVVPPWVDEGHEPVVLGTEESFLIGRIERKALDFVRAKMPFYRHMCGEVKGNQ